MSRFPEHFINELNNRVRCSQIVGKHVKLHHKNGDEYSGLCPFHKEKTPSFTVSDNKGFYHCFGCGAHGDTIKFVMELEGLKYPEAIEKLATDAGMEIPKKTTSAAQKKEQSLYDIMNHANSFFMKELNKHPAATAYLKQRQITQDLIEKFQLGYAPDDFHALHHHLNKLGVSDQLLLKVGLLTKNDKGKIYDRFRNRIIFPIKHRNNIVAFGGRILGDGKPKYLNSPETEIFKKGHILYTNPDAQKEAYKKKSIIVTEGYMDTIALSKANIDNVVAPLGTAITLSHIQLLWNMAPEPILCLDGDTAGQQAMAKAIDIALPQLKPGYSLRFAILPKGLDPDDLIKQQGPESIKKCIELAIPMAHALWNLEYKSHEITTPEQWASLEKRLEERANLIEDKAVQYRYKDFFRQNCWQHGKHIRKNIQKHNTQNNLSPELTELARQDPQSHLQNNYESILLSIIINHPKILEKDEIFEDFIHIDPTLPFFTALREPIIDIFQEEENEERSLSKETLSQYLEKENLGQYIILLNKNNHIQLNKTIDNDENNDPFQSWDHTIKLYRLINMEKEYKSAIEENEKNTTEDKMNQMLELQKEIAHMKKMLDIH